MTFTQCEYSGEQDKLEMMALARACATSQLHVGDLPYRLSSWAVDDPGNACLWRDGRRRLCAWAALQTPFWSIDCVCDPALEAELYPQLLAWAEERAQAVRDTPYGHPAWFDNVFATQAERIRALQAAGFASQADVGENSWSKVLMLRPYQAVPAFRIPAGFVVRSLQGAGEAPAYVELHCVTFESRNMTVEWRRRILQRPEYVPDLDVVVAAPDGRLGAFCICWLSEGAGGTLEGRVEPLGCHPDFRRYALGRLALAEGLRRLQAHGAQRIYVETDNDRNTAYDLYRSLGFAVLQDVLVFRKDDRSGLYSVRS